MSDINIRKIGRAGRITFTRPKALNALSYKMALAVEDALDTWAIDPEVEVVVIDAEGEKAFCAGGDIAELYDTGTKGDFAYGQKFWADEYRMNAKVSYFPKPIVSFMQGFTMGGGVGVGCHASNRIVGDSSQIAMPEVGIGLVPDVGGSYILANAPGHLGEYLGLTASRMGAADAILAGFADSYIPESEWPALIAQLETTADPSLIASTAQTPPTGTLAANLDQINAIFDETRLANILTTLRNDTSDFAAKTLKTLSRNSPLAMGCALDLIRRNRDAKDIREALQNEYRYTYRATEHSDFLEGIRAAIIDKDRNPQWRHRLDDPLAQHVAKMMQPLGDAELSFQKGD